MQIERIGHAAAVLSLASCLCAANAHGAGGVCSRSADEAIAGALANVKSRYRAKLDHYGLTESYFDETSGICDLMLLDVPTWTKYQIVYYRATDEISWPRIMPKGVAKDLMQDRLLIQKYELLLGKEEKKAKDVVDSAEKPRTPKRSVCRKKPKPPPLHKEPELAPEEKAVIEDTLKNAREASEAYEKNRKKPPLAQTSDFRQMDELKRGGMSGDEIAWRFGIDRVRGYNAAHPKNPIKASKHSKPGADETSGICDLKRDNTALCDPPKCD